jgi:Bifunctional DNA primase/polymerase, N-terminal
VVAPGLRAAGHRYISEYGWAVFLEITGSNGDRRTIGNCPACADAGVGHDRELCVCLYCHGFYAATKDHDRWEVMCDSLPNGTHLGLRTGEVSGVFAVDFDTKYNGPQLWQEWAERSGLGWSFPQTRTQRTKSGGFHLLYQSPSDGAGVGSHNGVNGVRGVDIKGDGGLIIVDPSPGYHWIPGSRVIRKPSPELLEWARDARGSGYRALSGKLARASGGDAGALAEVMSTPCPEGIRDDFMNALAFALRKHGYTETQAAEAMQPYWCNMEGHGTQNEFRWDWVLYKIRRIWSTIPVDAGAVEAKKMADRWLERYRERRETLHEGGTVQLGRRTFTLHRPGGDGR